MNENTDTSGPDSADQPSAPTQTHSAPAPTPPTASSGGGMVSQDDKTQATLMWALSIFFGFVPSLIFFLIAKEKPFVYRHSAEALALSILTFIAYFVSGALVALLIGLVMIPAVLIFHLVICIMGAMAANNGKEYNPPIASALAKSFFKV